MKIYTRTGDDGTTGLIGGARVSKSDLRMDCYGAIDELNAAIGLAAAACDESPATSSLLPALRQVQNELFVIGSHVTLPEVPPANIHIPKLDESIIARLETQIDAAESELKPLQQFILPGGAESAARLHLARTICRRAERLLVAYAQLQALPPMILTYTNRLSDWLFVMARLANLRAGVADVPWVK